MKTDQNSHRTALRAKRSLISDCLCSLTSDLFFILCQLLKLSWRVLCNVIWFGFHTLHLCCRRWFQQTCQCSVVWGKLKRCQSRFLVALWALAGRYAAGEWSCRWRRWRDDACASARPGGDGEMMVVGCSHCRQPSLASFLPSISAAARSRICSLHASLWRRTQVHMWEPAWQHTWLSDSWGFLWSLTLTFGALCLLCRNAKNGKLDWELGAKWKLNRSDLSFP